MSLRSRFERAVGLGPRDEPRAIEVTARRRRVNTPVVSTPGARLRLVRSGGDGEIGRLLLWCLRRGVAVELVAAEVDEVWLDGERVSPAEAQRRLRGAAP